MRRLLLGVVLLAACSTPQPDGGLPPAGRSDSPRHGEWVMVPVATGDSVRAWLVHPERARRAPVVVVIHEIYGLTPWLRGVADQLAASGFIAIAPDLLTGSDIPGAPLNPDPAATTAAIRSLPADQVHRHARAVAEYAMALPNATRKYGIVGFCWGGGVSFEHAVRYPDLGASVVYYGASPRVTSLASVRAPVLGLYGSRDARINASVPATDSAMRALRRTYRPIIYEGAGHGFLRQLDGQEGANQAAAERAWPETVAWFRRYLERT